MHLYKNIFLRSARITWRHKFLWWFGLFTLLWSGKGIEFEMFFTNARVFVSDISPFHPAFWHVDRWVAIIQQFSAQRLPGTTIPLLLMAVVFVVVVVGAVLATFMIAHIGLVAGFGKYGKSKNPERVRYTLDDAMEAGKKYLGSVLFVQLVGKGISYSMLGLVAGSVMIGLKTPTSILAALVIFLVVTFFGIMISLIIKFATNYIVLFRMRALPAMVAGLNLLTHNLAVALELALIMIGAYFFANIAAIMLALLITSPLLVIGLASLAVFQSSLGLFVYTYVALITVFFLLIFSSLLFATWHAGNWTLFFLELTRGQQRAVLSRFLRGEVEWKATTQRRR